MGSKETQQATPEEVLPWDMGEPGFTYYVRNPQTFILYLQDKDSRRYEIDYANPDQMGIRLLGPNANEIVFKAQRVTRGDHKIHTRTVCEEVVQQMRMYPKGMDHNHRTLFAAILALFYGLERRVR
jgi:hypothetical protein